MDSRPLFITGNQRLASRFAKITAGSGRSVTVVGGETTHRGDVVRATLEPHLAAMSATDQGMAIDEVAAASGTARFSAGLSATLTAAGVHRVDLLVVEEDFAVESHSLSADEPSHLCSRDPLDDVVDELIESVLDGGGRVQPVANGALDQWDRVAGKLRH